MHDGLLPTHEPNMPAYTEKLPNMDQLQCPLKRSAADGQTKGSLSLPQAKPPKRDARRWRDPGELEDAWEDIDMKNQ